MTKLTAYILGFILSIGLTVAPLVMLWMHEVGGHTFPSHEALYIAFVMFAVLQMGVQLSFFLHLEDEDRPRWNFMALCFALLVVAIVVGGTLWIMDNLAHMQHEPALPFIHGEVSPQSSND
jgi:cytochrome o ubiquinol oxidase operon protein cyoD